MDKIRLTDIVVTAAITTIINASLIWLYLCVKNILATSTIIKRIKAIFNKNNLNVTLDLAFIYVYINYVIKFSKIKDYPSRLDIIEIIIISIFFIFILFKLVTDIMNIYFDKKHIKREII